MICKVQIEKDIDHLIRKQMMLVIIQFGSGGVLASSTSLKEDSNETAGSDKEQVEQIFEIIAT